MKEKVEEHPRFPTAYLLRSIYPIIDFDFAVAYMRTLNQAQLAMAENGTLDADSTAHLQRLNSFFLAILLQEVEAVDKFEEIAKFKDSWSI